MQDCIELAEKNRVKLIDTGPCQFCGADTKRGVHECLEIFNLVFQVINSSNFENHFYRFLIEEAHTLQHPEIHVRWNNHFHLSRLHLIFKYKVKWTYDLSPRLSDFLNKYKGHNQDEYLHPPKALDRGSIKTTDILEKSTSENECKELIRNWALEVYNKWHTHHTLVDNIAKGFLNFK